MSAILATATAAKSGSTVTATINGIATRIQVARDLAVATGDVLVVERVGAQWFAVARVFPSAPTVPDNETVPNPKPGATSGTLIVSPVETRSYRPEFGWRTDNDDVYQGSYAGSGNQTGCAFYGDMPHSLTGATVTGATVKVMRLSGGDPAAQPTTLWLLAQSTRPSGAPTRGNSTAGPLLAVGGSDSFMIPNAWAQAMVNGTAGGLALYGEDGAPYVRYAGRGSWSPAFTLTIDWTRST